MIDKFTEKWVLEDETKKQITYEQTSYRKIQNNNHPPSRRKRFYQDTPTIDTELTEDDFREHQSGRHYSF